MPIKFIEDFNTRNGQQPAIIADADSHQKLLNKYNGSIPGSLVGHADLEFVPGNRPMRDGRYVWFAGDSGLDVTDDLLAE